MIGHGGMASLAEGKDSETKSGQKPTKETKSASDLREKEDTRSKNPNETDPRV